MLLLIVSERLEGVEEGGIRVSINLIKKSGGGVVQVLTSDLLAIPIDTSANHLAADRKADAECPFADPLHFLPEPDVDTCGKKGESLNLPFSSSHEGYVYFKENKC